MKPFNRLIVACLLGSVGALAHSPALAEQWRIVNATVDEMSQGPRESWQGPEIHAKLPNAGAPFQDHQFQPEGYAYPHAVWGTIEDRYGYWSEWRLYFTAEAGAAPSVDLAGMKADFSSLEFRSAYGVYEGRYGWYYGGSFIANVGLDEAVPITALGDGRYQASWLTQASPVDPLYSVNLTFVAFPEGTPWSYAPVPEASSALMALAGLGALGLISRRQRSRQTEAA